MKPIYFETPKDAHYFFGYYDKSPISLDRSKLLALKTNFIDRIPNKMDRAVIGYFDLNTKDNIFHPIAETSTFNWQQGCMLHWFGDKNKFIIYNDLKNNKFVSIIKSISDNEYRILPMSIYSLSSDNRFAICIDNERHYWCRRGYSYDGVENINKNLNIVPGDAIFYLDIENGEVKKIITIEKLLSFKPIKAMKHGIHYLEHTMLNPSNNRLAFLHRWKMGNGIIYSRLFTVNLDGTDLVLLNDSGRMSHFCWKDDFTIFGWGGVKTPINSFRKYKTIRNYILKPLLPIYKRLVTGNSEIGVSSLSSFITGDCYMLISDKTAKKEKISTSILNRDGHPSFKPFSDSLLITDTYPDNDGFQSLILYDYFLNKSEILDSIETTQSFNNSPNRCDLHPKWSFDGAYITIDILIDGLRGIRVYKY